MTMTETMRPTAAAIPLRVRTLRKLNPLILRLLHSRAHGLASRDLLILHLTGRRTGRAYALPLSYVGQDGALYLCSRPETSSWWRNIGDGTNVRIAWRGRNIAAHARVLAADSTEALAGLSAFLTRNPGTGRLLYHVASGPDRRPNADDLAREVARSIVVRIDPTA